MQYFAACNCHPVMAGHPLDHALLRNFQSPPIYNLFPNRIKDSNLFI